MISPGQSKSNVDLQLQNFRFVKMEKQWGSEEKKNSWIILLKKLVIERVFLVRYSAWKAGITVFLEQEPLVKRKKIASTSLLVLRNYISTCPIDFTYIWEEVQKWVTRMGYVYSVHN